MFPFTPSAIVMIIVILSTSNFVLGQDESEAQKAIEQNGALIEETIDKQASCEVKQVEIQAERAEFAHHMENILEELASGHYCSECSRSKSEIEALGNESFSEHLGRVKGEAIPMPQNQIQIKKEQLERELQKIDDRYEKQMAECEGLDQKLNDARYRRTGLHQQKMAEDRQKKEEKRRLAEEKKAAEAKKMVEDQLESFKEKYGVDQQENEQSRAAAQAIFDARGGNQADRRVNDYLQNTQDDYQKVEKVDIDESLLPESPESESVTKNYNAAQVSEAVIGENSFDTYDNQVQTDVDNLWKGSGIIEEKSTVIDENSSLSNDAAAYVRGEFREIISEFTNDVTSEATDALYDMASEWAGITHRTREILNRNYQAVKRVVAIKDLNERFHEDTGNLINQFFDALGQEVNDAVATDGIYSEDRTSEYEDKIEKNIDRYNADLKETRETIVDDDPIASEANRWIEVIGDN